MNDLETKQAIVNSLAGFATRPLAEAASEFFAALGYHSERRMEFPSLAAFLSEFDHEGKAAKCFPNINPAERGKAVLVQQLTSEELAANSSGQFALARSATADLRQFDSYLFLTIPVGEEDCTRTTLANRARALNGLFKQPVLVLFRHGTCISLAITYRRTNKRDQSRDVIERKVTFIKDIVCRQPHPGHLAILVDFSLPALSKARQRDIRNFADLDDAWRESLSTQLLNRQFYDEIANWYFWARDHWVHGTIKLPSGINSEADASLFLIRLLTRLIFCWFLKEKSHPQTGQSLIPEEFFDSVRIQELLRDASPSAGTYYTAILQNLFFATLNTEMDGHGEKKTRRFIETSDRRKSDDHMVHQVWRNANLLADVEVFERLARRVPFLNGGLFECLDERIQSGKSSFTTEVRIDGFSSDPNKQPKLPNILFFGLNHDEAFVYNLSDAYGDSSRSIVTVRPLLEIFRRYKFTLTENTPIEEEVALDPELLGHVFENLLAAYNPETGTVARKATGSFYTPRVVVDWMVDEALVVQLESVLKSTIPNPKSGFEARIRELLSWDGTQHSFSAREVEVLIDAIQSLKALDPACGSGAFPMGLLQKLVLVLRKLDPANQRWKARQLASAEAIESAPARTEAMKAIERAFARDNDDYGRKLYLIENCLYGVDIQPVAVQIAKLRFFIALVVDQKISPREENYGILALPNLETKIVAANTLLGLKRGQLLLGSNRVRELERRLQQVRHDYFTARRYQDKKALRTEDRKLCQELADSLAESGECTTYDARRLAEWNPYDTNVPAPFFDPGWMFGLAAGRRRDAASVRTTLRGNLGLVNEVAGQMEIGAPADDAANAGFDILIGNPPYVRQEELKSVIVQDSNGGETSLKEVLKTQYECYTGTADLYVYFFERSFQLLRTGGVLSFITSNKYLRAAYGERLRTYLLYATHPCVVLDFGDTPGLFTAVAYPCVLVAQKVRHINKGGLPKPEEFKLADRVNQLLPEPDRTFRVMTWTPGPPLREFPLVFEERASKSAQRNLQTSGWSFGGPATRRLNETIRLAGKRLTDFVDEFRNGIKSGLNKAFLVDDRTRESLIAEHSSSAEVLKRFVRGKHVQRWRIEPSHEWIIYVPWHFPLQGNQRVTSASPQAESLFKKQFPAIYRHLRRFHDELANRDQAETGIRYEWYALARSRLEYEAMLSGPKLIYPDIADSARFAFDAGDLYPDCTLYFIPNPPKHLVAVLNSPVTEYTLNQLAPAIRGGFRRFKTIYMADICIPAATLEQQLWCERLAEALIWLHRPTTAEKRSGAPLKLMTAFFEQWLNGLVYELFFANELHERNLRLFDETAKTAPPALGKLSDDQKISGLKTLFEQAYDTNSAIRSMLFSLRSLEAVRIIEETSQRIQPEAEEERE